MINVVGSDRVNGTVDAAHVAENDLSVALLAVSRGHEVMRIAKPGHVATARTRVPLFQSLQNTSGNDPVAHDVDRTRIPQLILAILGACAEQRSGVIPLHLLQLRTLQLQRDNLSLRKDVPNATGAITTQ